MGWRARRIAARLLQAAGAPGRHEQCPGSAALFFATPTKDDKAREIEVQINSIQHASRQQLQDEVLALIRSRSIGPAGGQRATEDQAAEAKAAPVGPMQTEMAVKEINHVLKLLSTSLHFEIDEQSGKTLVKVVDRDSGEVLRQIPSEATLQIARSLDKLAGHLVNQSV